MGRMFIRGGISSSNSTSPMTISNSTTSSISGFSLYPNFGYYISEKWVLGIELAYGTSEYSNSVSINSLISITNYKAYNH